MIKENFQTLESLMLPHGLYKASTSSDYRFVWIRDSAYMALAYMGKACGTFERTIYALFDLFRRLEDVKLTHHTKHRPYAWFEYLHARYNAETLEEMPEEWGHAQHDSIGAFLWMVGEGHRKGHKVFRDEKDREILQKLGDYLVTLEYWKDPDNGMWEENKEVHASSVGACYAGLRAVDTLVKVPLWAVVEGLNALLALNTRESESKDVDLAQLSLIYPYHVFSDWRAREIIKKVEERLLRARGVARYVGDSYYSTLEAEHGRGRSRNFYEGTEAEWAMGLPWLALCHLQLGNKEQAWRYIKLTEKLMPAPGIVPELYYAGSDCYNVNTPLGWGSSLYILAREAYDGAQ